MTIAIYFNKMPT